MKTLAALVLALVALVHYGPDLLAMGFADPDGARRAIYYVMRSLEGAMQYALIALLALELVPQSQAPAFGWREREADIEPPRRKALAIPSAVLVVLACGWGMVEHIQAGACRLVIGIATRPPAGVPFSGLCDDVVGVSLYSLGLAAVAFIAAVIAAYSLGERHHA